MKKNKENNLLKMRHSCSHLMAAVVLALYPKARFGIGPSIEDGFYYDFDIPEGLSEDNLPKIEEKMRELAKQNLKFEKTEVSIKKALETFKKLGQTYKLELIKDLKKEGEKEVTLYKLGNFVDLCQGPHLRSTKEIGPFKLLSVAGAYWKGNEKKPMLTRIYGICFASKSALEKFLIHREEAQKRDHRKLGKELDLFSQHEDVGPGLILWHPKLSVVREEIELWWRKEHRKRGYQYAYTPHIGKEILWKTSGHTDFYKELMYPPLKDERNDIYYVKPMNCPFHMLIYNSRQRSYKELPIRWAELGTVYRYELEGVRHGIMRPRGFTQDDAHIICTKEQLISELEGVLDFAIEMNAIFGFKKLHYELSVRDPKDKAKYIGEDKPWKIAEQTLKKILDKRKIKYNIGIGEAKFYGPAIDLKVEDALGRLWQGTTIQFDFNLPQKFKMTYIGPDGKEHTPYMIHRTLLGSMERFLGCLIEQHAGAFPVWLAPVQAIVIPITDKHVKYSQKMANELKNDEIRAELDDRSETTSAKIRDAEIQKIPYMLVVGDREIKAKKVNVRTRGEKVLGPMSLAKFLKLIKEDIAKKRQV